MGRSGSKMTEVATRSDAKGIVKEDITLPNNQTKLAFVLHNVFTKEECKEYIRSTEQQGYEAALLNMGAAGQALRTDIRNSGRCIVDSHTKASQIFERIKDYLPKERNYRKLLGLNERLRFLRYDVGQYFRPHYDGMYHRENGERSYITVQIYLNEGFQGGETTFMKHFDKYNGSVPVVPKTGSVLIFEHEILHEGSELIRGRKYALRTDVMYSATRIVPP